MLFSSVCVSVVIVQPTITWKLTRLGDRTLCFNLVKNVSAFYTPFAPLGLAMGWIDMDYTPFASLRLRIITYQHPTNAKRAFIALISVQKVYRKG